MKLLDIAIVAHVSSIRKYHRERSCPRLLLEERHDLIEIKINLADVDQSVLHTDALEKRHRLLTVGTIGDLQYDHWVIDHALHFTLYA